MALFVLEYFIFIALCENPSLKGISFSSEMLANFAPWRRTRELFKTSPLRTKASSLFWLIIWKEIVPVMTQDRERDLVCKTFRGFFFFSFALKQVF